MRASPFNWSRLRKGVQILFLALWLTLWTTTATLKWGVQPARLAAVLDPLLALSQTIASRTLTVGMLLSLITVGVTLVIGRAWCGWLCPIGTILDFFPFKDRRMKRSPVAETWRGAKYLVLLAILVAAIFGNLTLVILDPITLWTRIMTGGIGPALNTAFTGLERVLSNVPALNPLLMKMDQAIRPAVFPLENVGIRLVWLPTSLLIAMVALNVIAERFWCRYLCPLGGLLGFLSRVALFKRKVAGECSGCAQCAAVCPTGTIDPKAGFASDPAECTLCMDCLQKCPTSQIRFSPGFSLPKKQAYDPGRRQVLLTSAATLLGLAALKSQPGGVSGNNYLLRPPGAEETDLLNKCLRCGLCLRTCPTGALHASITESGLEGLFTPVLIPRLGYCLYTCNQCGMVCPVQAIPPLSLEDKHQWLIGEAFIDENRCIPWADGTTCIVCEEMCPLPDKAITLEVRETVHSDGSSTKLKLPHVNREKCIGCGICEYKCPRSGEAAIRVYRT